MNAPRFPRGGTPGVPSLSAGATGIETTDAVRGNDQFYRAEPRTRATDARAPDDRRVAIKHRQSWSLCRPLRGWGSSLAGSGYLGLTPPGYELAPRSGLEMVRQLTPSGRFASRGAAKVHSLAASAL